MACGGLAKHECAGQTSVPIYRHRRRRIAEHSLVRRPVRKAITILLAAAAVALMLLALALSDPPWIPKEPPREEWRVVHPKGFSIVCPPGWSVKTVTNPPYFSDHKDSAFTLREFNFITLRAGRDARFAPWIRVCDLGERAPSYLSWAYKETVFLNMKAYERNELFSRHEDFTYELVLANKGRWYQILYDKPIDDGNPLSTNMPAMIQRYLQSFRPSP